MKLVVLFLCVISLGCQAIAATQQSVLVTNVNIVDVENKRILPDKNVLIKNGKIAAISDLAAAHRTSNLTLIDGKDGYITPGLIDMHVHMYEQGAYKFSLSHGVTHVRIMNGLPQHLVWRDNIQTGLQIGSSSTVSSPIISGNKNVYLQHGVETAEEARQVVREYQAKGYDLIKVYGSLNKVALLALVDEAKKLNMPVAKHGPHGTGDMSVLQLAGLQSFEHVEDIYQGPLNYQFAPQLLPNIIADLKATQVAVTPTLNIFNHLTRLSVEKHDYLASIKQNYHSSIIALEAKHNQVKRWLTASHKMAAHNQKTLAFLKDITLRLQDSGVPLLVGSDSGVLMSPHGLATHDELRLLQQAGLSAYQALAAATINPAKALKLDQQIGQIAVNFVADFIYTTSNPMENLSVLTWPDAVVKNGHWYAKEDLTSMREQALSARSIWQELKVLSQAL